MEKKRNDDDDDEGAFDFVFDFVLQFLESDRFDASVMDFVDEKCEYFDSEEENKFIYTDIHREFREHIEALLTSNLGELGVTMEVFYESCVKGRNDRDVNRTVFEKLVAMEDFSTFKKIMVKRNMEIQIEAFRSISNYSSTADMPMSFLSNSDLEENGDSNSNESRGGNTMATNRDHFQRPLSDQEIQDMLHQSLMEMELMHRQEELEQQELERAMAMSLKVEEERLRLLASDSKYLIDESPQLNTTDKCRDDNSNGSNELKSHLSDSKDGPGTSLLIAKASDIVDGATQNDRNRENEKDINKLKTRSNLGVVSTNSFADPKPLKMRGDLNSKPLPSIRMSSDQQDGFVGHYVRGEINIELEKKKQEAEEILKRNQEQLQVHRREEENIRKQLRVDPEEAERRASYMREQRDRLIAAKKAQREMKVQAEMCKQAKSESVDEIASLLSSHLGTTPTNSSSRNTEVKGDHHIGGLPPEEIERRRTNMAKALARRMKIDLIEDESMKLARMQEEQFNDISSRLRKVEDLRHENQIRQATISEIINATSNKGR